MNQNYQNQNPGPPSLLVDGYISQCFGPQHAEAFFLFLLKNNSFYGAYYSGREGGYFIVTSVPRNIQVQFPDPRTWIIDRGLMSYGTMVPQGFWVPHTNTDRRQHVAEAELQMPIFFEDTNGSSALLLKRRLQVDATVSSTLNALRHLVTSQQRIFASFGLVTSSSGARFKFATKRVCAIP